MINTVKYKNYNTKNYIQGGKGMNFQANQLTKSFGEKHVLKNVNLQAESGKAVGLLGRNGAGKTTTIRIIMGVFPPDSGSVFMDGKPIQREKLNLGYLPEERGLYPKKVIFDQLLYLAELRGMKPKDAKASIQHWLDRLEMGEYINKKLDTLSKGNQQKIQLAATLLTNPDFVILDEPFSGLDPVNAMMLKDIVKELIAAGKIVLFSSHQMNYVEEFCDSIAILNKGEIVLSGDIKQIKHSYDRTRMIINAPELSNIKAFCDDKCGDILTGSAIEGDVLKVKMKSADLKSTLLSTLTAQNFDIDGVYVYEPSLNDIFVEYTEDAI
jgi:ABC-2 type transport system ATP-binding protein